VTTERPLLWIGLGDSFVAEGSGDKCGSDRCEEA
jgi:hypothetical protein